MMKIHYRHLTRRILARVNTAHGSADIVILCSSAVPRPHPLAHKHPACYINMPSLILVEDGRRILNNSVQHPGLQTRIPNLTARMCTHQTWPVRRISNDLNMF